MKSYEKLLLENKAWAQEKLSINPDYFKNMAKGQKPDFMWIGSSDSRIPANEITNTEPGDIFIHQNIGNLVLHTDFNMLSVLQYAVEDLEVHHIIVCGHSDCDAIHTAMDHQHHGLLNKWLRNIKDVYRLHEEELSQIKDEVEKANRLSELNVKEQVLNLAKTSIIQHSWAVDKRPTLHGWFYDMNTGLIKDIMTMTHESDIDDIYKFNFQERGEGHYGFY